MYASLPAHDIEHFEAMAIGQKRDFAACRRSAEKEKAEWAAVIAAERGHADGAIVAHEGEVGGAALVAQEQRPPVEQVLRGSAALVSKDGHALVCSRCNCFGSPRMAASELAPLLHHGAPPFDLATVVCGPATFDVAAALSGRKIEHMAEETPPLHHDRFDACRRTWPPRAELLNKKVVQTNEERQSNRINKTVVQTNVERQSNRTSESEVHRRRL